MYRCHAESKTVDICYVQYDGEVLYDTSRAPSRSVLSQVSDAGMGTPGGTMFAFLLLLINCAAPSYAQSPAQGSSFGAPLANLQVVSVSSSPSVLGHPCAPGSQHRLALATTSAVGGNHAVLNRGACLADLRGASAHEAVRAPLAEVVRKTLSAPCGVACVFAGRWRPGTA